MGLWISRCHEIKYAKSYHIQLDDQLHFRSHSAKCKNKLLNLSFPKESLL